jgi:predicted HicB family RNase H-like nuclease
MAILKYKDYEGTADVDMDSFVCRGKILFINDLVTYQAVTPAELQKSFEEAVEDYLTTCSELGRQPQKPLKGMFNVRVAPQLHKAATLKAHELGTSLNDIVTRALDGYLNIVANKNINLVLTATPTYTAENSTHYMLEPKIPVRDLIPSSAMFSSTETKTLSLNQITHVGGIQ